MGGNETTQDAPTANTSVLAQDEREAEIKGVFAEHGVEMVGDGEYLVPSSDGQSKYTVRFEGSPETMRPEVRTWSCTCPAGEHGKTCKHINRVANASDAVCDAFGYE